MKVDVLTLDNKVNGSIDLSKDIFEVEPRADIMSRVVNWQLAKRRAGTHKTKGISDISGTTKKPFAQKHTGRARQGSLRSPQMRGGAVIFGPVVRSHEYDLQKKVRQLGLRMALSSKLKDKNLIVLESEKVANPKTKDLEKKLIKLGWKDVLVIGGKEMDVNFKKASANIKYVDVLPMVGANVYDVLNHSTLVLTKDAVEGLTNRLKFEKKIKVIKEKTIEKVVKIKKDIKAKKEDKKV